MIRPSPFLRQCGFTLIECMIALTLGMLVIAAATALLLSAQKTYFAIDDNARIDDAAAGALNVLGGAIRQAAYADRGSAAPAPNPPFNALFGFSDGVPKTGNPFSSDSESMPKKAVKGSDILVTRFMATDSGGKPDGDMRNCVGGALDRRVSPVNRDTAYSWSIFYIGNGESHEPELYCRYFGKKKFSSDAIVGGVEKMQFLYGIDRNGDGLPETFLQAAALQRADWRKVTAVGITLSLRGAASARRIVHGMVTLRNRRAGVNDGSPHAGH